MFGNMVNYTKRVESSQSSGGLTLSDVAKREVSNEQAQRHAGLRFQSLQVPFKGFQELETVWLVITSNVAIKALGDELGSWIANKFQK
jgi:hypothetical protein